LPLAGTVHRKETRFGHSVCSAGTPEYRTARTIVRRLQPERIGCELTENWQIDLEQSTNALICHDPDAKYFNA
jgi:5-methyltetrahydrofolate--homocysteine methyltransferase